MNVSRDLRRELTIQINGIAKNNRYREIIKPFEWFGQTITTTTYTTEGGNMTTSNTNLPIKTLISKILNNLSFPPVPIFKQLLHVIK